MLADKFKSSACGNRVEFEDRVTFVVVFLFFRLRVPGRPYFLNASLAKFNRSPQDLFGVDLRGLRTLSLGHRNGSRNRRGSASAV